MIGGAVTDQEARQIAAPDAWPWPVSKEAGDWIKFASLEHNALAQRLAVGAQMQACESESPSQQGPDVGAAAGGEFDRKAHDKFMRGL